MPLQHFFPAPGCARVLPGLVFALIAPFAHAEGFVAFAQMPADLPDFLPGDGKCSYLQNPPQGSMAYCTLRAAIMETNALPGKDTIYLMPAMTYTLTVAGLPDGGEEGAQAGDLNITSPVLIQPIGDPANAAIRATIDANGIDRVLNIVNAGEVELVNVGITGGFAENAAGGGVRVLGSTVLSLRYADVFNNVDKALYSAISVGPNAELHVQDSSIRDNFDHGISNYPLSGAITVERSAIYGNIRDGVINNGGQLFMLDSTVSGNGRMGVLSATFAVDASTIIASSTIVNNQVGIGVSYASDNNNVIWSINAVLSGNNFDCYGDSDFGLALFDALNTVYGDDTCPLGEPADNNRIAPALLSALGDHGGPTPTHRPRADSPLIDAGTNTFCEESQTDQRGLPRIADFPGVPMAACDVGAVELESDVIFWHDYEEPL
jgi:hypothetical protein